MQEHKVRKQEIPKALTKALDFTVGRVIDAENDFGLRLLLQLAKQSHDKNVFISPFSVAIALAMIYNGAENATKQAMAATLGLNGLSLQGINAANRALISIQKQCDSEIQLAIANSIWIREGIALSSEFVQRISDDYGGKIVNMDFSASDAVDTINRWVADKTKGKIKTLVTRDMLNPPAVLFLITAPRVMGRFTRPYNRPPFHLLDGTRSNVP
jgi:serpin B